ncbi:MAG: OmpA family protein [Proteobacteria bacterium]|nr:OmpA family protein [Pseudomonadota bacterium]MBU1710553.1 OmpA family protein [Pseudomonadota bacterium]
MAEEEVKQKKQPAGAPVWMCTFADLMSLLMCFFILLLSFSEMDKQKFKQVAGSMEKAFGMQKEERAEDSLSGTDIISTEFRSIPMTVQLQIRDAIVDEMQGGLIEADYGPDGLILRVKGGVAFDSGKDLIRDQFSTILDKLGKVLVTHDVNISVSGHTDNVTLTKGADFSSNWGLSASRAVRVIEYWTEKYNFPPARLSATGYADGQPLESNDTAQGRARNRRVEFKIRPNQTNIAFDGLEIIE